MNCENCIHYNMCLEAFRKSKAEGCYELIDEEEYFAHAEECNFFIDKTRYIELPCKVGDTVYIKWGLGSLDKRIYPVKVYALKIDTKKNNTRICVEGYFKITAYGGEYTHYYNGTFAWNSFGKSVFFTQEEAERSRK